jgi:glucose/arabinose dehydrogenase
VLKRKYILVVAIVIILILALVGIAFAVIQLQKPTINYIFDSVVTGMSQPVGITHAGDDRLFINERNGIIRILDTGEVFPRPFLDIRDRVNIEGNIEQGLLSLAFHPNYNENGYLYVTYTDTDFTLHLERFQVGDDPNVVNIDTVEPMLMVEQETAAHNGGHLRFGSDGYLYVSVGDGGESLKPESTGQDKDDLLGKILRLDVDGGLPYLIPDDNPFVDDPDYRPEIWVRGLRNPWQFSFSPDSDAMFIADVGWSTYEEINYQPANSRGGENYGWRLYEGDMLIEQPEGAQVVDIPKDKLVFPIYFYPHITPEDYDELSPVGCAIIGGFVYRGEELSGLQGKYLYGDFCSGNVWTLYKDGDQWKTDLFIKTNVRITSFGEDVSGEIYLTSYLGEVRKLIIDEGDKSAPDGDYDYDLIENAVDNCREEGNPDQEDNWGEVGVGDACDQSFYTNGSSQYEIKIFQLFYGAFHIYGCEGLNCGFLASIESAELSKEEVLKIESETRAGLVVDVTYVSDVGNNAIYNVRIYEDEGRVFVDNLQILKSDNNLSWRTIS